MVNRLNQSDDGFNAGFEAFLSNKRETSANVDVAVARIIDAVRETR